MRKTIIAVALAAVIPAAGAASAQEVPGWPLRQTCKSGDDSCRAFELRTRGKISGIWATLPPDARSTCLAETEKVEKSYRLLLDCLANEMQRRVQLQARQR